MKAARAAAVAVATIVSVGISAPPAAASLQPSDRGRGECLRSAEGAAAARVRPGATVEDPGTVTRAEQRSMERQLRRQLQQVQSGATPEPGSVRVPVRVHILLRNNGTGGVSGRQVRRQMRVINRAFGGQTADDAAATPFKFVLKSIDRTRKTDWYNWSVHDNDDTQAKRALHQGRTNTLNVYIAGLQDGLLGYAYFPVPSPRYLDGLVILNESLPGGSAAPYNKGDTATHELGHWLNLYHTFQNGCSTPGDNVADTPRQDDGNNVFSCDEALDTCTAPGLDPVHNFMNYSVDQCMNRFTQGQADRMYAAWEALRAV